MTFINNYSHLAVSRIYSLTQDPRISPVGSWENTGDTGTQV